MGGGWSRGKREEFLKLVLNRRREGRKGDENESNQTKGKKGEKK